MLKNKTISVLVILFMLASFSPALHAEGLREAGASLLLPTTGQAMNGQLGDTKTKIMAGVEVAAVTTVTLIGFAAGGPAVWFGAAPLVINHVWSATDAYKGAKQKNYYAQPSDPQLIEAQRTLEISRENRFEREQADRDRIRERVRRAGEAAS